MIAVDIDSAGSLHVIDDFNTKSFVSHPTQAGVTMTVLEYLTFLNTNRSFMQAAGWSQTTNLPGFPLGTTRWQALVITITSGAHVSPAIKALGLI